MSNQKGFSKIAIVIIVFILIGGAYFVFSKKDKNIPAQNTENQNSQSSQSVSGDLSMNDWKTYQNDDYGFEIKYPEGYEISEKYPKNNFAEFTVSFYNKKTKLEPNTDQIPPTINILYDKANNISWAELIYKYFGDDTQIKLLEERPNEIKNLPVSDPVKFVVEPVLFLPGGYAFKKDGYSILVYVSMYTNEESLVNLEEMIKTFKFTK